MKMATKRSASRMGTDRSRRALTIVNAIALMPIPTARTPAAAAVNHRSLVSRRVASLRSCQKLIVSRHAVRFDSVCALTVRCHAYVRIGCARRNVGEQANGSWHVIKAGPRFDEAVDRCDRRSRQQDDTARKGDRRHGQTHATAYASHED